MIREGRKGVSDTDETADYIEISNANVIIERVNEVSLSLETNLRQNKTCMFFLI